MPSAQVIKLEPSRQVRRRLIQVQAQAVSRLREDVRGAIQAGQRPVIATTQRKGGSGKTTCTRSMAEFASLEDHLGIRVLTIDTDPQCSLSKLYLSVEAELDSGARPPLHPDFDPQTDTDWNGRSSSADMFYDDGGVLPYPVTRLRNPGHLHILPGDSVKLVDVEEHDSTYLAEKVKNRIREWVNQPDVREAYDLLIIDTAPSDHPLTQAALRAATHLLIPVTLEQQGIDGLHEMLSMWRKENSRRTENEELKIIALQPNLVSAGALHKGFETTLRSNKAFASFLSPIVLKRRQAIAERDVRGLRPGSIYQLAPSDETRQMMTDFGIFTVAKAFGLDPAKYVRKDVFDGR